MQQVKSGDTVKVHYHGRLTDGTTFDSSESREPLEFEVGSGMVIAGFDNGVTGMFIGEKKTVNIPVGEAYGEKQEDMFMEFSMDRFPEDMKPEIGMTLNMSSQDGQSFPVIIREVLEDKNTSRQLKMQALFLASELSPELFQKIRDIRSPCLLPAPPALKLTCERFLDGSLVP